MSSENSTLAIIRAFNAAAGTYDEASQVQREIARELVSRAALACDRTPQRILDLGCGAGHVTESALLQWPRAEVTALDAAPAMLAALQGKFPGVVEDIDGKAGDEAAIKANVERLERCVREMQAELVRMKSREHTGPDTD